MYRVVGPVCKAANKLYCLSIATLRLPPNI